MAPDSTHAHDASLSEPPECLIAAVRKNEARLRMLPSAAMEAMRLSEDPHCCIADYAAIIERDVKLSADILSLTNSAAYSPLHRIVSLQQAIVRLGFRQCENLVLASSVISLMRRMSPNLDDVCGRLWPHCHLTAFLAAKLNSSFHLGFHGEEFVCGLMHDFGRALLAVVDRERFDLADTLSFDEPLDQLAHEEAEWDTNHCQFGAWYARQQRLPSPIPEVILHHHQPDLASEHVRLTSLISVADHMANHLQRSHDPAGYNPTANPFLGLLASQLDHGFETEFAEAVSPLMEQALSNAVTSAT